MYFVLGADGQWSTSAAFLDYDNDGLLDLWVTRKVDHSFTNNTTYGPLSEKGSAAIARLRSTKGFRTFFITITGMAFSTTRVKKRGSLRTSEKVWVTVIDFNDNGYPDVYVANDSVVNFLFRNNRDGTFWEIALGSGVALDENRQP
jgi:hypothetical protein